jgi:hypothetical protein
MLRNILVIVGAALVGVIVMQPFAALERYVTEGRVFSGVAGMIFLQVIGLIPTIVAAAVMAALAAFGVKTSRPEAWAPVVAATVAGLLVLAQYYVAPEWVAWLTTIAHITIPSVVAWLVFYLVRGRRRRSVPAA